MNNSDFDPKKLKLLRAGSHEPVRVVSSKIEALLDHHFPERTGEERTVDFLTMPIGESDLFFVDEKDQRLKLRELRTSIETLVRIYPELAPTISRTMNVNCDYPSDDGLAPVTSLIRKLAYEFLGIDPCATYTTPKGIEPWPDKVGSIQDAEEALSKLKPLNSQMKANEAEQKAHMAWTAVLVWEECSGKTAPTSPSPSEKAGSFFSFLADLIQLSGKDWGVERVMSAYQKSQASTALGKNRG